MIGRRFFVEQLGVTLAEILVSIAVLAIVSVATLGGIFTAFQGNDVARTRIAANSLARSEVEYVRSSIFENATWSYTLPGGPYPFWDVGHNSLPAGYDGFTIQVSADNVSGSGYDMNLQKLTAVVTYQGDEVQRIETYRAR
jgi:prepilin-type N-terminal cleavage/methylation domain-containing protein